ncbi:bifunctional phosphoglucose/phosphomannose isomerase [bacterium]|nr:bifunctional phosphoglucose/phosphomannose isomerase [bacterium]
MLDTIKNTYQQFLVTYENALALSLSQTSIGKIVLGGMGGSALPADILNDYLGGSPNIAIVTDYTLPSYVNAQTLVFCSSFSGNTEETLQLLDEALKKNASIVVLCHGGRLKEVALSKKLPFIQIPSCIQPRCAAGYFFAAILGVLEQLKLVSPQKNNLTSLSEFLKKEVVRQEEVGRVLAKQLKNFVPIVYGASNFYSACRITKIKFNENAKVQSFFNTFPELNHNEMVGFTKMLMKTAVVYFKGQCMHPRIYKRMDVMKNLLSDKMPFFDVELKGDNHLQELWDAILIGDFTSYYLAKEYGVDPAPVDMVEEFKKNLDK